MEKTVETLSQVSNLINCLTNDEDLKQELWVHYLSGNPIESFADHLSKLKFEYSEDIELKKTIWFLIKNPPSDRLIRLLENFTDFEKSIICLCMLGLSADKIAEIKGISKVRIRQSIATIRYNECWREYGTQKKSYRR